MFKLMKFNHGGLVSHSFRKGVAKMVSYDCPVTPPVTFLCIRCVYSMVIFKERYLRYEAAGYQYAVQFSSSLYRKYFLHYHHSYLIFIFLKLYSQIMSRVFWVYCWKNYSSHWIILQFIQSIYQHNYLPLFLSLWVF